MADLESGTRGELLGRLVAAVESVVTTHPARVAVDGPPAGGKTTLADELAVVLRARDREVIRATIDDFLYPRSQRYRRGTYSGEACYHDSFDFDSLHRILLDPLGPGGDRRFRSGLRDSRTDALLPAPVVTAAADAVLLFDGVFLLRPELIERWDLRVFVATDFDRTLARARIRDETVHGSVAEVERRFQHRYRPSQQLYNATIRPTELADIVVHNDEPQRPAWEPRPARTPGDDAS